MKPLPDARLNRRKRTDRAFRVLALASAAAVLLSLVIILGAILWKSLPALSLSMLTRTPKGGFYLGKEGGILNAIVGSLELAIGATAIAFLLSLPLVLYLNVYKGRASKTAVWTRFFLDVLWGVPSIVYGAFGFIVMLALGLRASLLAGMLTVALLEFPIMSRAIDEVMRLVPRELKEASASLGATRFETAVKVLVRQSAPGILTGVLLAFGRGVGDAASVLFTAGFTDRVPGGLLDPAATLPLAIFFQLGTPFPEVRERAYASAAILTLIILVISLAGRALGRKATRHVVK
ncbi:MAG TPA: ABC transporter permease subunit [Candidatus Aminicenantes bacterium]|nr:ABC transporter permease subunit [Candidatus Aminicenantes bacterium]HRY64075.1 ABC transporter permease subunit [Candidatus Aminicenantes bacterium]HRZ70988.1 ABC transporter permease subunit [Candidatus Aminicenantes bacterium]